MSYNDSLRLLIEAADKKRKLERRQSGQEALENKLEKAMNYLGIPQDHYDSENGWTPGITQRRLWRAIKGSGLDEDKIQRSQLLHEIRVGLYSVLLMDYLNIKDEGWRHQMFAAYLCHDTGKDFIFPGISANIDDFGPNEMQKMKGHVLPDFFSMDLGPIVDAIVERHHYYRKNAPYPENPESKETPEVKLLAQILGIADVGESASTRSNNRSNYQILNSAEVKRMLIEEFGEQKLSYHGDAFPQIEKTGKEFIEDLYSANILGRKNPKDPVNSFYFSKILQLLRK